MRKGEMLVTTIFSFSHKIFKNRLSKDCENTGLFGKELSLHKKPKIESCPDQKPLKGTNL